MGISGNKTKNRTRSILSAMGSVASLLRQDAGSISGRHSGLKDPVLPQLRHRSQLRLRSGSLAWELHMPPGSQKIIMKKTHILHLPFSSKPYPWSFTVKGKTH